MSALWLFFIFLNKEFIFFCHLKKLKQFVVQGQREKVIGEKIHPIHQRMSLSSFLASHKAAS